MTETDVETLKGIIALLWCLLLVLALAYVSKPEAEVAPKIKPVEFCKLHSRPITECQDQHGEP